MFARIEIGVTIFSSKKTHRSFGLKFQSRKPETAKLVSKTVGRPEGEGSIFFFAVKRYLSRCNYSFKTTCRGVLRKGQASKPAFTRSRLKTRPWRQTAIICSTAGPWRPFLASSRGRKASLTPLMRLLFVRKCCRVITTGDMPCMTAQFCNVWQSSTVHKCVTSCWWCSHCGIR